MNHLKGADNKSSQRLAMDIALHPSLAAILSIMKARTGVRNRALLFGQISAFSIPLYFSDQQNSTAAWATMRNGFEETVILASYGCQADE
jgi:hypothetical protein